MKLLKAVDGQYVNPDMVENYMLVDTKQSTISGNRYEIVAYAPSYCTDFPDKYVLATDSPRANAQKRLDALAEWLVSGEDGIFNTMNIWENDNDEQ